MIYGDDEDDSAFEPSGTEQAEMEAECGQIEFDESAEDQIAQREFEAEERRQRWAGEAGEAYDYGGRE